MTLEIKPKLVDVEVKEKTTNGVYEPIEITVSIKNANGWYRDHLFCNRDQFEALKEAVNKAILPEDKTGKTINNNQTDGQV